MSNKTQQELIIESTSKRIVVLACPGSGKTTTLIKKIVQLNSKGVKLKKILSVTFTRKAAGEMLERLSKEISFSRSEKKNICTLHSFGCRLLFKYKDLVGLRDGYTIADINDKKRIIETIITEEDESNEVINSFLEYVSSIKNGFVINKYNFTIEQFNEYCAKMIDSNLIDLDDFIYLTVKILKNNSIIREKISYLYDYIFVDEYQDINKKQNELLDLLIREDTNVLYVGDDDQSIYEFRGSNPNFILEKTTKDSGYDVYYLTRNYRSEKPIVEFSKKVLMGLRSKERREKTIIANKTKSTLKPVRCAPFSSKNDENDYVVNEIFRLITQSNIEPREIAVLSRYNFRLIEIKEKLQKKGIDATTSTFLGNDNDTSKTIKRICDILNNLYKEEINPSLCIAIDSNSFVKRSYSRILELINIEYGTNFSCERSFQKTMDQIIELNPIITNSEAFQKRIRNLTRCYAFAKEQYDLVHNGKMPSMIIANLIAYDLKNNKTRYELMDDIYEYAFSFCKSSEEMFESDNSEDDEYLSIVASMNFSLCEQQKNETKNCVRLMTAHQSKGLQFDAVFIVGLEAGGFPCNIEKLDDANLDNERRLFYVCVTRARELLYLTATGYAVDNTKDLADKSFIYTIPETYFSTKIESFEEVSFTYLNDDKCNIIKAKDEIIESLERDNFIQLQLIKETDKIRESIVEKDKKIEAIEFENNEFREKDKSQKELISKLINEADSKDSICERYKKRISELEAKIIEYDEKRKQADLSKKEKEILIDELNKTKSELSKYQSKYESLNENLNKEVKKLEERFKNKDIHEKLHETKKVIEESVSQYKNNEEKFDLIYKSILGYSDDIIP